ncbi:MAG: Acyl-CoA carboxylase epsilon subunit [Rhodoglobus sp.]|nr:Acyl-CoA carboxylase epsilon subunit [Rhodoglobus sp.]
MSDTPVPDLRIVSKGAAADDAAAVTAVLSGALDELASGIELEGGIVISAWQRSQRPIRTTVNRGPGAWRGFSG